MSLFLRKKRLSHEKLNHILNKQINELKNEIKNIKIKHEEDIFKLNQEMKEIKEQNNLLIDSNKKLWKLYNENLNNHSFLFSFREGVNYTLSKYGKIAEKTSGG